MKASRAQRILYTAVAAIGIAAGAAGLASAATSQAQPTTTAPSEQQATVDAPEKGDTADSKERSLRPTATHN